MAKFKAGDVVEIISGLNKGERGTVGSPNAGTENGKTLVSVYGDVKYIVPEDSLRLANSRTPRSSNAVVRNALATLGSGIEAANARTARNAGIWGSAKEAEDRSDVFVRAALGRTKYNFDTEAGTLREVIKLLASAEQTPKIKKNTEKLKDILSRVEKAGALFKGI